YIILLLFPFNNFVIYISNGLHFIEFKSASTHFLSLILSNVVVLILVINIITPIKLIISLYLKRFHDMHLIQTKKTLTTNNFINEFLHIIYFPTHFII